MTENLQTSTLKALRASKGLSMEKAARLAGVSLGTYLRAEQGKPLKRETFEKITEALGQKMTLGPVKLFLPK